VKGRAHTRQDEIESRLRAFLAGCKNAVLVEPGDAPLVLGGNRLELSPVAGGLLIEAWDGGRNLVRRVSGVISVTRSRMVLEVERFGRRKGTLTLVDRARPAALAIERRAARLALRERLGHFLRRQFAGWRIEALTTEASLEHSLSPTFPRAILRRGDRLWTALAAPDELTAADQALTFGLIWLDYVRLRERRGLVEGLCLLLPAGKELATCLRLRWINPRAACFTVFLHEGPDWEELVDPGAHGNLETELLPPDTSRHFPPDLPEARIEALLRAHPPLLDPDLLPAPIYGQVAAWAGGERGILDLLACGSSGRLAVIEVKASPDPHLPLQALDYWMRVDWHRTRELSARGYFPGIPLRQQPPRLLLAAPSLAFHPSTETILRCFSPSVEVERIGIALQSPPEGRQPEDLRPFQVMFRLRGARAPF
jgi:hypothetical protein